MTEVEDYMEEQPEVKDEVKYNDDIEIKQESLAIIAVSWNYKGIFRC